MQLENKLAVITGAGRGIGRAMALAFAHKRSNLALLDLNQADLDRTRELCEEQSVKARTYVCNVAREDDVSNTLDCVVRDFGRLDVMINNAGITKDALLVKVQDGKVVGKMSLDQWRAVMDVNLTGVFLGVVAMTVVWAKELARHGIRTGAIAPGFTRTEILDAMKPEMIERAVSAVPLKRMAEPAEMAHAAVFIAENDYFSGRVVEVDGGQRI
jgi:3-oxoacyl-[acyl-carrier protein] reductase